MVLYDQFGRPMDRTSKTPPKDTSILSYAPMIESAREYVAAGLTPEKLAAVFRAADAGDMHQQAQLFEQIEERSGHLVGEKTKRVNAIMEVDFEFEPASEDPRDIKVCEALETWWDNFTESLDVMTALQDGVGKGYSALEINWDVSEGQAVPSNLEFIEQRRFIFRDEKGYLTRTPRLITDQNLMGLDIPAWKTLFHDYGGKSGHPTRSGIYRVCAWNFLFANYAIKDWLIFCEVYGMPIRVGKFEPGASKEDKQALKNALMSIGTDAAGIISKSTEIEFIEQKGTASGDLYSGIILFCNKEISKALLGQTLTADIGDQGSRAAAQTHNEIRMDLLKADSRAIAATLRHQLFRPWVYFNYGFDTKIPFYTAPWEEEQDLTAKAAWMDKVLSRTAVPAVWFREQFGIPEPKKGEETVGGPSVSQPVAQSSSTTFKAKSSPAGQDLSPADTLDALGIKTQQGADLTPFLAKAKDLLDSVSSLVEYRDRLIELGQGLSNSDLGTFLAKAMIVSDLAGRFDV